jgi:transcriptional regulator with XRE-family HTH domain
LEEKQTTIFDTVKLSHFVHEKRGEISFRELAKEIGVSASTLSRVEACRSIDLETFFRLCLWLGISPESFMLEKIIINPDLENLLFSKHDHSYTAISAGTKILRICSCGKANILEVFGEAFENHRKYKWHEVEEI